MVVKSHGAANSPLTLMLDDETIAILRRRADLIGQTLDAAASDLIQESAVEENAPVRRVVNGILLLPDRGERRPVTSEMIYELMEELE